MYAARFEFNEAKVSHGTDVNDTEALQVLRLGQTRAAFRRIRAWLTSSISAFVATESFVRDDVFWTTVTHSVASALDRLFATSCDGFSCAQPTAEMKRRRTVKSRVKDLGSFLLGFP